MKRRHRVRPTNVRRLESRQARLSRVGLINLYGAFVVGHVTCFSIRSADELSIDVTSSTLKFTGP